MGNNLPSDGITIKKKGRKSWPKTTPLHDISNGDVNGTGTNSEQGQPGGSVKYQYTRK